MSMDFDEVIYAHSRWKIHLKHSIYAGESEYSVSEVADDHQCQLGQWLESFSGKSLLDYNEMVEMHQAFHKEAARILELALQGNKEAALEGLASEGHFDQLATKLIHKLGNIKRQLEQKS